MQELVKAGKKTALGALLAEDILELMQKKKKKQPSVALLLQSCCFVVIALFFAESRLTSCFWVRS